MSKIVQTLRDKQFKISFIESVTGGALAAYLVNQPTASLVFEESFVTYSNRAKERFGVTKALIDKYTLVSKEVVKQMVYGLKRVTNANVCIAITGNAGPTFQKDTKELVSYAAFLVNDELIVKEYLIERKTKRTKVIKLLTKLVFEELEKILSLEKN